MPEMQEQFPAPAGMARIRKNQGAFPQLVSEDPDDRAPFREI
jgi:hypothetical protein